MKSSQYNLTRLSRGLAIALLWLLGQKGYAAEAVPGASAPPFSLRQTGSGWWLHSPAGEPFFSLGVCVLQPGAARQGYDPENPGYAFWQHYADPGAWADATLQRLKTWKFTTIGGWADFTALRGSREQTLCLTPVLHIGSTAGAPWWDMWDAANIRRMEEVARGQILPVRDDPNLLGYYSDNELGWWNATLWKMTLEQPASSGQRQRLVRMLREYYQDDWRRLAIDFQPSSADNWRQLQRGGMLFLRPGGRGIHAMRQFLGLLAERYYQLMRDIIRKYDPRGLYLGDRYQSFFYPEVARASARYVDAASSNLNASWQDGSFPRCYLDTLHALTGKPVLVSEFYLAATNNRSGNRNTQGIYPVVATQSERAASARRTLIDLLQLHYVIGADWFQFADEPTHGREDGENFNFGLVDIHDRPYEEITKMFAALDPAAERAKARPPRADARSGVPRAPAEPFAHFEAGQAMLHWPREQGFVPPSSEFPLGDLYLCWRTNAVYIGLLAFDIIETAYYPGSSVPKSDRALWTVKVNGREVRARIGAGREAIVSEPSVRVENLSGQNLNVRNLAAMELPASLLGAEKLKAGDAVELDVTLLTHAQAYRMQWKGRFVLGE